MATSDQADQDYERLARLLDEHAARLTLYARQWSASPEDAVQEAFVELMRATPAPENPLAWLYRVVRNRAISSARGESTRSRHESRRGELRPSWFEHGFESAIDATEAEAALRRLPGELREVVLLKIWSSLSFEAIASVTGVSSSTAHRRYETALALLRQNWSKTCQDPAG